MSASEDWNPRRCIIKWLSKRDDRIRSTEKAKSQRWFNALLMRLIVQMRNKRHVQKSKLQRKQKL